MKLTQKILSLCLIVSVGGSTVYADLDNKLRKVEERNTGKKEKEDAEREKQKAMLLLVGSGALLGLSKLLQDRTNLYGLGKVVNLTAGEFQAACALASTISAIGIFAQEGIAKSCRSMAWRIPLMAAAGGIISHEKVNAGLSLMPLGVGDWFKANPASDKKGIFAIYAIGAWYMLKPTLDRLENFVSNKVSEVSENYYANE